MAAALGRRSNWCKLRLSSATFGAEVLESEGLSSGHLDHLLQRANSKKHTILTDQKTAPKTLHLLTCSVDWVRDG